MRAVGKFVVPTWVSSEPAAIQLEATKNGEIVDILDLSEKQYYVIGRNKDLSTITLEHPSISKQHAAILNGTPHGLNGCSIMDLGSSNGTFLGSTPAKLELIQAQRPVLLPEGSFVKFGESSRIYTVKPFKKGNQPGTEIGKFVVPTWISANPHPLQLHVSRQGELLGVENLSNRHYYIFGRNRGQCNKVLDHPSISKQHAVIVHGSPDGSTSASIIDLEAANGTYVGKSEDQLERIPPLKPTPVGPGWCIVFGESSRLYTIREQGHTITQSTSSRAKGGEGSGVDNGAAQAAGAADTSKGAFSGLVTSTTIIKKKNECRARARPEQEEQEEQQQEEWVQRQEEVQAPQ
eukprot:g1357.t1